MYRIFAYNPDGSQYTIYDPVYAGALPVIGPRSSEEVNEAGTLEFTLLYGHSAYGFLQPKMTYISAYLGNQEFFYGRLVNNEPTPIEGQVRYSVAGALSFLKDSEVPPDPRKKDGSGNYQTMTAEAFFARCIAAHNADIGDDSRRTFSVGIVRHSRKDERREYRLDSYQDTMSVIESNILNYYGGFIRTRRDPQNGLVIDWIEDQYGDTDAATLSLGQNIISLTNRANGEGLFTTIRPIGAGGILMEGGQTIDLFPNSEMASYGKIVRSVTFSDATTAAELRTKAQDYVSKLQKTILLSSDIKLLDMQFVDGNAHGVNLGDTFTHVEGMNGIPLMVTARNREFENPQNDSCTLKNQKAYDGTNSLLGRDGGGISKRTSRNSAANGVNYKYIHEFDNRLELTAKEIAINGEQIEIHARQLVETAEEFARVSHKQGETDTRLGIIEGTGVFQNSEHITQIAGKFQYDSTTGAVTLLDGAEFKISDQNGAMITVGTRLNELGQATAQIQGSALWTQRDNITGVCGEFEVITAQDGTKTLRIKSGGGIKILRNNVEFGLYDEGNLTGGVMVGKLNDGTVVTKIRGDKIDLSSNEGYTSLVADKNGLQTTVAGIQSTVSNQGVTISSMTGSALWTQRDNITGVCGEFDVVTLPNGSKYLRIKSGGGIKILRNNAEFGLYDAGNLTGGVMVEKLNDDTVTTTIRGDHVNIASNASFSSISGTVNSITQSALWQTKDNITNVVGEFEVVTDPNDGKKTLKIKSGGGVKILRDNAEFGLYDTGNLTGGVMVEKLNDGTVVTKIHGDKIDLSTNDGYTSLVADKNGLQTTVAGIQSTVSAQGVTISSMTGSALWTQRDNITGVCGEFEVATASDGTKTLKIKSGGGVKILRDNTEFGLYDDGTLTAGVIVNKINGGTTTISGNKVVINGTTTISSVMSVGDGGLSISKPIIVTGGTNPTIINNTDVTANNLAARTKLTFGSGAGEEGGERNLTYAILGGMIKEASVSANGLTLSLTKFNGDTINFSKAVTSMSGAWGSGSGTLSASNTLTVTASPQNTKYSASMNIRLSGTMQYSNFTAEAGDLDGNGAFTRRMYIRGYLQETVSGSGSYVDLSTASTGGTVVARISTTQTWNNGRSSGRSSVVLNDIGWGTAPAKDPAGNTNSAVATTDTGLQKSASLLLDASEDWSGNSKNVYLCHTDTKEGNRLAKIPVDATTIYDKGRSIVTPMMEWDNGIIRTKNPSNTDRKVEWDAQVVHTTTGSGSSEVHYATLQTRVHGNNPWTTRINKTLAIANVDDDNVKLRFQNSDAFSFNHGKYTKGHGDGTAAGWAAAYGKVGLPTSENTSSTKFVASGPSSTVGEQLTHNYYVTADNDYAYLRYNATNGTIVARASNPGYGNGWGAGWAAAYGKVGLPTAENTTTRFVASGPSSTVGEQLTHNYYVTADNDYAYLRYNATNGTIVARAYNPGYANGWAAAYGKVGLPTSENTTTRFVASGPSSTVGEQLTHNYYVTVDNDYAYLRFASTSGTIVARAYNPGWNNGYDTATSRMYFTDPGNTGSYMTVKYPESSNRSIQVSVNFHLVKHENYIYLVSNQSTSAPAASDAVGRARLPISVAASEVSAKDARFIPQSAGSSVIDGRRILITTGRPSVSSYLNFNLVVCGKTIPCTMVFN